MHATLRHAVHGTAALGVALLFMLPAPALAARAAPPVLALTGKPCFLLVSLKQAVRADAIRDIRIQSGYESHYDVDRGTLYVNDMGELDRLRRRIMACYEDAPGMSAVSVASPPPSDALPPAPRAPAVRK